MSAFREIPIEHLWDPAWWQSTDPGFIVPDPRPGQPASQYWWVTNQGEVSQFIRTYQSRWLPIGSFNDDLADVFFAASRHYHFTLHFNKGLSGADPDAIAR